ncbi:hypothetical protein GYMLUDRAFT_46110 [Collybiopsis luxurians FD-317 M1]|uniref:Uncharacterized protein n=1 Tax=Collybiopsis luxurians FD-317 M1 TaxID=944289 RepID=A0A0D0BQU9_9AGAR|nr:hypothetical protein GYMLUDRAFT_46110 [Collybiopsis luxurians FD-317 M1]
MALFTGTQCITVITQGPGTLTLLSYGANTVSPNVIGGKSTSNSGQTRWMVGFSHDYTGYAFIWGGSGQAVYRIGSSLQTFPVGTKWTAASVAKWGATSITSGDVSSEIGSAVNRDNQTTTWVIPGSI